MSSSGIVCVPSGLRRGGDGRHFSAPTLAPTRGPGDGPDLHHPLLGGVPSDNEGGPVVSLLLQLKTGVIVVNVSAHRDTGPRAPKTAADPIAPAIDHVLKVLTRTGARTVAAWGSGGHLYDRSSQVAKLLAYPLCLARLDSGNPATRSMSP